MLQPTGVRAAMKHQN